MTTTVTLKNIPETVYVSRKVAAYRKAATGTERLTDDTVYRIVCEWTSAQSLLAGAGN